MLVSMTGFGRKTIETDEIRIDAEIKSINSKQLDISINVPKAYSSKEIELLELIRTNLKRGKVSARINISRNFTNHKPKINADEVKYYYNLLAEIKNAAEIDAEIKLEHLINFRDLFYTNNDEDVEKEIVLVKDALLGAINEMKVSKATEGQRLEEDITSRLNTIGVISEKFQALNRVAVLENFEKMKERAKQLVENITQYNERLEMELAVLVDKTDISEEITRLNSHIKFFTETIEKSDEAGKRLAFISQEMLREANTISNKTESMDVLKNIVIVKEEIEKIREQIANLE